MTKVRDVSAGNIRVMIIQRKKDKRKFRDGWLFYPSLAATFVTAMALAISGEIWHGAGLCAGVACLAWWAILAFANTKASRWGAGSQM